MDNNDCFITHECDTQELYKNTKPILECKNYPTTNKDGKQATVTEVPMLTCEALWRTYQQEAIDIIAPNGKLIEDPIVRNQAISSAYASLWLSDDRFQWAGLGAFASKQVGCGLMSAYRLMKNGGIAGVDAGTPLTKDEQKRMLKGLQELLFPTTLSIAQKEWDSPLLESFAGGISFDEALYKVPGGLAAVMYSMLGWGNMLLFLDIFPLHAFYKKRGIDELKQCLGSRKNLFSNPIVSKYWTAEAQAKVKFGEDRQEILDGFQAIADGNIANSVEHLAKHEQINILQPLMYENLLFSSLMQVNHASYTAIGNAGGLADEIQLTLASECRVDNERIIKFVEGETLASLVVKVGLERIGIEAWSNLANVAQRMEFVIRAATKFDVLLHNAETRPILEKSLREIKAGQSLLL